MDKRLKKRHQRQVARAKDRIKLSEPDLRTPEQIKAAREASRPAAARDSSPTMNSFTPAFRGSTSGSAKTSTD